MCVVGGDGTFHEVVNGLMQHPISRIAPHTLPALSVIPAGTGNSMVRELQGISSVKVSSTPLSLSFLFHSSFFFSSLPSFLI